MKDGAPMPDPNHPVEMTQQYSQRLGRLCKSLRNSVRRAKKYRDMDQYWIKELCRQGTTLASRYDPDVEDVSPSFMYRVELPSVREIVVRLCDIIDAKQSPALHQLWADLQRDYDYLSTALHLLDDDLQTLDGS